MEIIFVCVEFRKIIFKRLLTLLKTCCRILLEVVGITTKQDNLTLRKITLTAFAEKQITESKQEETQ